MQAPSHTRRSFLSLAAAGAVGALTTSACTNKEPTFMAKTQAPATIALQLWTVREAIDQDPAGTLQRIAAIGYPAVETAFFPEGISISQAGELVSNAGLDVCSVHCELPVDNKHKDDMLAMAEAYKCNKMIWHGWPEDPRYKTVDGTKELVDIYHECASFAQSHGLAFGLHNHWWEFETHDEGHSPYEILLDSLDKDIFFELDTYWIKVAGHNPADVVKQFANRAPFLHIKDGPAKWHPSMDADEPEAMTAVGQGTQDFSSVVQAASGNTEWMIVELDNCATDMMTAVEESFVYLTENGLAGV